MTSFDSLGLSERALEAVKLLGYSEPTPVQQKAIPVALEGRDLIAAAKTGTGKTAAFSLPLLDRIEYAQGGQGPLALVVTPTRELAEQIGQVCETIAGATHHRVLTVVGGLSYKPQTERLRRGVDVLIATPGRLIDLMDQKAVRLGDVQALVLDEADRMLDMGFWPSVKRIVAATPTTRQTLLFSATIDDAVNKHAKTLLRKPARIEVAHRGDVADTITQYIVRTPKLARPELLSALLREKGSRRFAEGEVDIVVATDVLARGIDVDQVSYVVNYDLPTPPESYVHRIGRTGRAGEAGFAVSFVTPETEGELADIQKLIKQEIPQLRLEGFNAEDAERTSAEKQAKREAKTDPDIQQAKKELAAKARKKRKQAAHTEEGAPVKRGEGKRAGKAPKNASAARAGKAKRAGTSVAATQARPARAKKATAAKAPARSGDFRPGRAHRADLNRRRSARRP